MPAKPINLSKQEARKLALASQLLKRPSVAGQSARRLARETIEQIGYVQIDTISVLQRAHHHVFWSRVPTYKAKVLEKLERDGEVFEYWSHAASYLPMKDFRYTLPVKAEILAKERFWYAKDQKVMQHVVDRITHEGPLMSKDFEKPEGFKSGEMWEAAPTKQALQNLFMEGRIMVRSRQGFQKVYDLTERVLHPDTDTSLPTREEYLRYLINRDIQAHGLVAAREMGYLIKGCQKEIRDLTLTMSESGEIMPCRVGRSTVDYFTSKTSLALLEGRFSHQVKFLSPFDNLVINRQRSKELFDFDYILECYVPGPERVFGYFALPVIWKNNLVGQIDVKANRETQTLEVRNAELHMRNITDEFLGNWEKALDQFMSFQGVSEVSTAGHRSNLGEPLMSRLFPSK